MHSNASLDLYPWGWTGSAAPNGTDLANISAHISASNASPSGNSYQSCQPPNCLYGVDGDAFDWGYGVLGIPSLTTEVAGSTFFPPYACLDNPYTTCGDGDLTIGIGIWPTNRGPLVYSAKIARTPYLTTRGPDAKNVATTPMTVTQGIPSIISGTTNYNWSGNNYLQNVAAAEYYVDTPPWAGGTGIPMSGTFTSSTVNVNATIDTTSLSVGRHIIFVRGRGVNDYQGFQSWGPFTAAWLDILPSGGPTSTPTATQPTPPPPTGTPHPHPPGRLSSPNTPNKHDYSHCLRRPPGGQRLLTHPQPGLQIPTETVTGTPPTATDTSVPTETPTACTLSFEDVPVGSTFYAYIQCLACRGIINGYPCGGPGEPCNPTNDPYFRPGNDVTRGQFAKIAANSAGFNEPPVHSNMRTSAAGSTFFDYIWRLYRPRLTSPATHVVGQASHAARITCLLPPNANVTRGQLSKIDANAAGFNETPGAQQYEDVARLDLLRLHLAPVG